MFKLVPSNYSSSLWRTTPNVGIAYPDSGWAKDPRSLTDYMAAKIVGMAKRRFDLIMPSSQPKAADTYQNEVFRNSTSLKGFCFIAADEFEVFYRGLGYDAKAVRVLEGDGGDHFFTVIKKNNKKDSLILDATWRQFSKQGDVSRFCLVGTLQELKNAISGLNLSIDLADAYTAGMKVIDSWKKYQCFT